MLDSFHASSPQPRGPGPTTGPEPAASPAPPSASALLPARAAPEGCSCSLLCQQHSPTSSQIHRSALLGAALPLQVADHSCLPPRPAAFLICFVFFFLSFFILFYAAWPWKHPSRCQPPPASPREGCRMLDAGHQPRQRQEPGEVSMPPCWVDAGGPSRPRSQPEWKWEPLEKIALQRGTYLYICSLKNRKPCPVCEALGWGGLCCRGGKRREGNRTFLLRRGRCFPSRCQEPPLEGHRSPRPPARVAAGLGAAVAQLKARWCFCRKARTSLTVPPPLWPGRIFHPRGSQQHLRRGSSSPPLRAGNASPK